MFKISDTFAGCTPNNKALGSNGNVLFYLSANNIIFCDQKKQIDAVHFDFKLNCISVLNENVVVGDIMGNIHMLKLTDSISNKLMSFFSYKLPEKIQDCCVINSKSLACCTLKSIYVITKDIDISVSKIDLNCILTSIAFYSNNLLVGTISGMIYHYKLSDSNINFHERFDAHSDLVTCITFSGSNLFATCSQDHNVKLWEINNNNEAVVIQTLNGHSDWVNAVFWRNMTLYSSSSDKTVRVWEQSTHNELPCFYICTDIMGAASEVLNVSYIADEIVSHVKTGGLDKIKNNEYFTSGHIDEIKDLDWKYECLLTCSLDKTSRIFIEGKERARPQTHGFAISSIKWLPIDKCRLISGAQETILRIYEGTCDFLRSYSDLDDQETINFMIDCLSSDKYCESAYLSELNLTNEVSNEIIEENLSEVYLSTHVFKEHKKVYGHFFDIKDVAVSKDLIISCNRSAAKKFAGLFVWDIDGEKLQYIEEHELGITKIAISPCSNYAISVGRDKLVCLYNIIDKKLSTAVKFYEHTRIVYDCGFSRDSRYFATCSRDGKVILYDTVNKNVIKSAEFEKEVTSICFSTSNDVIAIGNANGECIIVNYDLDVLQTIKVVSSKVNILRFNSKGNKIAIGGADGLLRILTYSHSNN